MGNHIPYHPVDEKFGQQFKEFFSTQSNHFVCYNGRTQFVRTMIRGCKDNHAEVFKNESKDSIILMRMKKQVGDEIHIIEFSFRNNGHLFLSNYFIQTNNDRRRFSQIGFHDRKHLNLPMYLISQWP
jgi:hypothetical protein